MIPTVSQFLVLGFGVWILAVGLLMLLRPDVARKALAGMASTPLIHFGEHGLRFLAGLAFVGAAELSRTPQLFTLFGGFMAISSVVIVLAPRKWHIRYAEFWAERFQPWMIRAMSPPTFAFGAAILWASGAG